MANRKDIEAGRAHVLLYVKNQVQKGLVEVSAGLKRFASQVKQVAEPLNRLSAMASQAGAVILGPMVAAVTQLEEAKKPLEDIRVAIAEGLGRPLLPILMTIRKIAIQFREWAEKHPDIIRNLAAIGVILIGVGVAAKIAASAFILIAGAASIASVATATLAFLLSPAGLVILGMTALVGLIAAGVVAWVKFTESGKASAAQVRAAVETIMPALDAIFKLLISNRWELAGRMMGNNIRLGMLASLSDLKGAIPFLGPHIFTGIDEARFEALGEQGRLFGEIARTLASDAAVLAAIPGAVAPIKADLKKEKPITTAATAAQAFALQFGFEGKPGVRTEVKTLDELKKIRADSIKHHKEVVRELKAGRIGLKVGP